ncbi:TBC1 domain family member 2A-like isoform X2 [Acipenser ruthenus]|uniref:TBC1 domain family member 2A-like isoform X2 n=1 Tax=Acipenser ruthenus TaxID=7906 RepID=UPI002741E40F|nr:TBC1 domain family member 2A-like isoform X2 [Acipenser ruthenus]
MYSSHTLVSELVRLLHKALEAAQQEKRTSKQFLAAAGEQERLELVRHKERCIADLDSRLEALLKDKEELEQRLAMQDCQVNELQQHVQLMMEKNNAKQEVILKLSEQVAACMADPQRTVANSMGTETFCRLQEKIEHLKVILKVTFTLQPWEVRQLLFQETRVKPHSFFWFCLTTM